MTDDAPKRKRGRPRKVVEAPARDPFGRWTRAEKCRGGDPDPDDPALCWATPVDRECAADAACAARPDGCVSVRVRSGQVCASRRLVERARDQALARRWPRSLQSADVPDFVKSLFEDHAPLPGLPGMPVRPLRPGGAAGSGCNARRFVATAAQAVVRSVVAAVAARREARRRPADGGLLVWHVMGAGKTCTAAMAMDAFWDCARCRNIVVCTSPTGQRANPPDAFYRCLVSACPRFAAAAGEAPEDAEKRAEAACRARGVLFVSFTQLAHQLMLVRPPLAAKTSSPEVQRSRFRELLRDSLLIVDEVHSLFRPFPRFAEEYALLRGFLVNRPSPAADGMFALLLTGTPGTSVEEVVELLNVVRPVGRDPIPEPAPGEPLRAFSERIAGTVSYVNASADASTFPIVENQPVTRVPMSETQFEAYREALRRAERRASAPPGEPGGPESAESRQARMYANSTFRVPADASLEELREFSAKLPALLAKIKEFPDDKHLVYTSFAGRRGGQGGQGVHAIAAALQKHLGYEAWHCQGEETPAPGRRRLVVLSPGDVNQSQLECVLRAFNDDRNARGDLVRVILATDGFDEGISFMAVKHVHLFEPLLTFLREKQVVGRASRMCSHRQLSVLPRQGSDWTVKVHRYISDRPETLRAGEVAKIAASVTAAESALQKVEEDLADVKGKRSPEAREARDSLREKAKVLRKQVGELSKKLRGAEAGLSVRLADVSVYNEARNSVIELHRVLQAVKGAALDCRLFREFHRSAEAPYECEDYTRSG